MSPNSAAELPPKSSSVPGMNGPLLLPPTPVEVKSRVLQIR